jgi:crossover junction endodeoxyribonuclease RusA
MTCEFTVLGKTATKGSTRSFLRGRKVVTMADNRNLGSWTQAAKWAALQAGARVVKKPTAVSLCVNFDFLMPRSVRGRVEHTVKPDIDKLLRAVLDALTGICYEDDSQVMSVIAVKKYGPYEQCRVSVSS